MAFLIGGANTLDDAYTIDNSVRFNDNDSAFLRRTFSAGSRTTFTISFWLKRGNILTSDMNLFDAYKDDNNRLFVYFVNDDLRIFGKSAATTYIDVLTDRKFKDPSAWYHFVIAFDTTQGTEGNRIKVYVNGVQETSFSTYDVLENYATFFNDNTRTHTVGTRDDSGGEEGFYDGYMSEVHYIDGAQKAASDFGKTDNNGVWIPIKYSGSYGTNGYYLEFQQTGTGTASTSTIGADTSGNTNHLTSTNLAATDITEDTCTNNFCTWNPLDSTDPGDLTYSEGNTKVVNATGVCRGTLAAASGKWYWEIKQITTVDASNPIQYGIADTEDSPPTHSSLNNALIAYSDNALNHDIKKFAAGTASDVSMDEFTSISQDDIIMFAFDADTAKLWVGKNGTWLHSGDPAAGSNEVASTNAGNFFTPCLEHAGVTYTIESNFGNPAYSISSSQSDDAGYGNFEYDVPAGFYSLCTKNLATHG